MNTTPSQRHSAFYRFAQLPEPMVVAQALRLHTADLTGSIIVAGEGISGAVAGSIDAVQRFECELRSAAVYGEAFKDMVFKHSDARPGTFGRMKVHLKPEIVAFGVDGVTAVADRTTHLSPLAWRELLQRDDLVLIDNRNSFEFRLGRFKGAVDPQVDNFRDFAAYVCEQAPAWLEAGRPVAMYCTGGIRCEKTSAWMQGLGLEVWQLEGGVLNYLQSLPDAEREWEGDCFVFDNRLALDRQLQPAAISVEQVYRAELPDEAWRLARARRLLDQAGSA
jgi:UPF0176 protein